MPVVIGIQAQTIAVLVAVPSPGVDASAEPDDTAMSKVQRMCSNLLYHRMMDLHEAGIKKPSRGDKLITARTLAYQCGDIDGVRSNEATILQRQATRSYARRHPVPRRAAIRRERALFDRPSDPPSGDEHAK